jgi:tetratricopeptide (TPR) repeat protein
MQHDRQHDIRGLPQTAASAEAMAAFDATVEAYMAFEKQTGERLKETLALDPQMPLALCLKGCFLLLFCKRALVAPAQRALAAARAAAAERGATARETRHMDALQLWLDGDLRAAAALWDAILIDHPHDLVALRLAQYLHFYLGDAPGLRASIARPLYAWDDSLPGYGYVLGIEAFALEECGDYAAAERTGRAAIERNPADIWAAHAVAHVMEMQDRPAEGIAWLDGLEPNWGACHNFTYHVHWHRCLFRLEQGDSASALRDYDEKVRADRSNDFLDVTNAIALLWRLEQRSVDVGARWEELSEICRDLCEDHRMVFGDAHFVMGLAARSDPEAVAAALASLEGFSRTAGDEPEVARAVGLPLALAAVAHRRGNYAEAVETLLPQRGQLHRIGGSRAQRDLFEQLLIDAALKAGDGKLTMALLSERRLLRPDNPWNADMTAEAERLSAA